MVVDVTYNNASIVTNNVAQIDDDTFLDPATILKWQAILS